jgi:hypothetical protein
METHKKCQRWGSLCETFVEAQLKKKQINGA